MFSGEQPRDVHDGWYHKNDQGELPTGETYDHALPVRAAQSRFGRIDAAVNAASRSELSQPLTINREHNGEGK